MASTPLIHLIINTKQQCKQAVFSKRNYVGVCLRVFHTQYSVLGTEVKE